MTTTGCAVKAIFTGEPHGDKFQATCNDCGHSWCDVCDPARVPLCHWCHGRGYSIAPLWEGTEGQDRESYSDEQDRESYPCS